jgi:dolichol-phosphate mannosyltransferase
MKIAIVLPTYNEQAVISPLINEIFSVCKKSGIDCTVIVVDDNSPDGTAQSVKELQKKFNICLIERPRKMGLGTAYITGFKKAIQLGADLIFSMDADFSHQPRSIPHFVELSKKFDVVLGSRYIEGGGTSLTGYRFILSKGANFIAATLFNLKAKDVTSGYRCYKAKVLKTIGLDSIKTSGYSFLEEILFLCKKKGFSIGETPIFFDYRRSGESKLGQKEIPKFFFNMLRLKLRAMMGKI